MSTSGSGALNPLVPVVNQGNTYLNGCRLTWVSTTSFTVGIGQCRDSTDTTDILMGSTFFPASGAGASPSFTTASVAVTVKTTVSGVGGVDVSTITASKLYSVFAVGDSRGFNTGSAVISLAVPTAGPSLPAGYDCWRYIGSVAVDSGSHFYPFQQTGAQVSRTMWYDSGTLDGTHVGLAIPSSATAASQTLATIGTLTIVVPQTALEVMIYAGLIANAAADSLWLTPKGFVGPATGFASPAAATMKSLLRVPCAFNTTPLVEIDYATSSATATVSFTCPGYVDQL